MYHVTHIAKDVSYDCLSLVWRLPNCRIVFINTAASQHVHRTAIESFETRNAEVAQELEFASFD